MTPNEDEDVEETPRPTAAATERGMFFGEDADPTPRRPPVGLGAERSSSGGAGGGGNVSPFPGAI